MRPFIVTVALVLILSACQTTQKTFEPLSPQAGLGGGSLRLCFGPHSWQWSYFITVRKLDNSRERIETGPRAEELWAELTVNGVDKVTPPQTYEHAWLNCRLWQFEASPGTYAIAKIREEPSNAVAGNDPFGLLMIAASEKQEISFVDSDERISEDTPIFEVSRGEMTYLGSLVFHGEQIIRKEPLLDSSGHWDGQSTDSINRTRLLVRYWPSVSGRNSERPSEDVYLEQLPNQTISALTGRELLLKDFPPVKQP